MKMNLNLKLISLQIKVNLHLIKLHGVIMADELILKQGKKSPGLKTAISNQ